jgi:hypothetical protein
VRDRAAADGGDGVRVEGAADDGRGLGRTARLLREPVQLRADDRLDRRRRRNVLPGRHRTADLLDEERVATGRLGRVLRPCPGSQQPRERRGVHDREGA